MTAWLIAVAETEKKQNAVSLTATGQKMTEDVIAQIPGAAELKAWFGHFPSFHDAYIVDFAINVEGSGHLKVKAFRMTDKLDSKGYFVLDRHHFATFHFEEVTSVNLEGFESGQVIIFSLQIGKTSDGFDIAIESSYGFEGSIRARKLSITFDPIGGSN